MLMGRRGARPAAAPVQPSQPEQAPLAAPVESSAQPVAPRHQAATPNFMEAARKRLAAQVAASQAAAPTPAPQLVQVAVAPSVVPPQAAPAPAELVNPVLPIASLPAGTTRLSALDRMRQGLRKNIAPAPAPIAVQPSALASAQTASLQPPALVTEPEPAAPATISAPQQVAVSAVPPQAAPAAPQLSPMERLRARAAAQAAESNENGWDSDFGDEFVGSGRGGDEPESAAPEEVTGVLGTVRVFNDWAVGTLWTSEREEVRLTGGILSGLTEGLEYRFVGGMKSSRHGDAIEVTAYEPVISVDVQAIERYFVKSFKGVGPVKAGKYIQDLIEKDKADLIERAEQSGMDYPSDKEIAESKMVCLAALRDQLLHSPWTIDLMSLVSQKNQEAGHDPQAAAKHLVLTRNLMLRLGGQQGFRESVAKSLAAYLLDEILPKDSSEQVPEITDLVEASWTKLVTNPYKPIGEAPGYGFGMAEIIARFVGIPKDSPMRLSALSEYAVDHACQRRGHVFLKPRDFVDAIQKVDPSVNAQNALNHALREQMVVIDPVNKRLYTPALFAAEKSLAKSLSKLLASSEPLTSRSAEDVKKKLRKEAEKINPAFVDGFDDLQLNAVASILTSPTRLHVLSGGPGTGKTSIIEAAVYLLKSREFLFAAPTGKAAKVLSGRVKSLGHTASTINSLLQGGVEDGFQVNQENPLSCDVLVIDESTMNGLQLADALLKAISANAHVIFLGDPGRRPTADQPGHAGQLPSISPGRFMLDLVEFPQVNHVHLEKTYRNSGGILEVVKEVGAGKLIVKDREAVCFHDLPGATEGFPGMMREYIEAVLKDGIEHTLLVMPKRNGAKDVADWNTTYANTVLRSVINPNGQKLPGTTLSMGDRILIRRNLTIDQPEGQEEVGRVIGNLLASNGPFPIGLNIEELRAQAPAVAAPTHVGNDDADPFDLSHCGRSKDGPARKERVVNGDTGTIIGYSMNPYNTRMGSPQWVRLALDDGRHIDFPGGEMASLDWAYALTVHSAQGSEYKHVIMAVTPGSADFMNQNMLFTGFSRAKESLSIYGNIRDLVKIAATPMPDRNSAMVERVIAEMTPSSDEAEQQSGASDNAPAN